MSSCAKKMVVFGAVVGFCSQICAVGQQEATIRDVSWPTYTALEPDATFQLFADKNDNGPYDEKVSVQMSSPSKNKLISSISYYLLPSSCTMFSSSKKMYHADPLDALEMAAFDGNAPIAKAALAKLPISKATAKDGKTTEFRAALQAGVVPALGLICVDHYIKLAFVELNSKINLFRLSKASLLAGSGALFYFNKTNFVTSGDLLKTLFGAALDVFVLPIPVDAKLNPGLSSGEQLNPINLCVGGALCLIALRVQQKQNAMVTSYLDFFDLIIAHSRPQVVDGKTIATKVVFDTNEMRAGLIALGKKLKTFFPWSPSAKRIQKMVAQL